MNAITIYYYTAWNGYSWQGCGAATAASLQRYMEAAGVLPGMPGRNPPFGGAIACQVEDRMGVAVYRCGIREKGDAFGRDSLFIALAFVPLEAGPVDFATALALPQMSPSVRGELAPVSVPLPTIASPGVARRGERWREESFSTRLAGVAGLREASALFFGRSCQLGLLQASFSLETDSLEDVSVSVSYRVFPEVAAFAEASRAYADARRLSRGGLPSGHPLARTLCDAASQLQAVRIDKMPGYTGLADYLSERNAELGGVIAVSAAKTRGEPARQASSKAVARAEPSGRQPPRGSGLKSIVTWLMIASIVVLIVAIALLLLELKGMKEQLSNQERELEAKTSRAEQLEREQEVEKAAAAKNADAAKKAKDKQTEDWNKERKELEKKNQSLKGDIERLNNECTEAKNEILRLTSKYEAATKEIRREYFNYADDTIKSLLNSGLTNNVSKISELSKTHKRIRTNASNVFDTIISDDTQLDRCIGKFKDVKDDVITAFVEARKTEVSGLKSALEAKHKEDINRLQLRIKELESAGKSSHETSGTADKNSQWKVPALNNNVRKHSSGWMSSCKCPICAYAEDLKNDIEKLKADAEKLKTGIEKCEEFFKGSKDALGIKLIEEYEREKKKFDSGNVSADKYLLNLENLRKRFEDRKHPSVANSKNSAGEAKKASNTPQVKKEQNQQK